jgi:regulator of CtrA degradation
MDAAPTAFFNKTYDETIALLYEARNYVAATRRPGPVEASTDRLRVSCETMRLTARLTQVLAWLLGQKAVHAGEITMEQLVEEHQPLIEVAVCMEDGEAQVDGLPSALRELLDRTHRLYIRVARLDEMVRRRID